MPDKLAHRSQAEQHHLTHPKYRADIDGLRAIAVMSVVGFHAFPDWLRGGFVGVDIFFIISGYLITSIILSSLRKGTFSFGEFYARRVKRIFPALILVMTACYVLGWFVLLPDEFKQLGKHITAGAGFVSNFFFWQEAGYFDNSAGTKPLLHLWSLGIEEQFYIVWPLMLYLAWKRRFNFLIFAVAIIAISFLFSVGIRHSDPVQAFYSPLTRFWELTMGSILAYLALQKINLWDNAIQMLRAALGKAGSAPKPAGTLLCNAQSIFGALLIGIAVLLVTKDRVYPGWWALLPTVGAYLIISAGQQAWLNRDLLSHRVMVWFGLISYPLYLWHWPLLSFARIMESRTPAIGIRLAAIALALVLAWLTYRLIEHPIRFGKQGGVKVLALALLMTVLAGLGYGTYAQDGFRERSAVQAIAKQADELSYIRHWDGWSLCPNLGESKGCRILDPSRPPDIAVIGDSHAGHLAAGLANLYAHRGENVVIKLGAGCMPFFEMVWAGKVHFSCDGGLINKALEETMSSSSIRLVILSGYALAKIQGNSGESLEGSVFEGYVNNASIDTIRKNADVFQKSMNLTLERLVASGRGVVFMVDVPELYFDPRECAALRPVVLPGHKPRAPCAVTRKAFEARSADYHRIITEARIAFPSVKFINAYEYFCDEKLCHGRIDGDLLYMSRDHLTPAGSRYLVRRIAQELLN